MTGNDCLACPAGCAACTSPTNCTSNSSTSSSGCAEGQFYNPNTRQCVYERYLNMAIIAVVTVVFAFMM